jgi:hypothetical protein
MVDSFHAPVTRITLKVPAPATVFTHSRNTALSIADPMSAAGKVDKSNFTYAFLAPAPPRTESDRPTNGPL